MLVAEYIAVEPILFLILFFLMNLSSLYFRDNAY